MTQVFKAKWIISSREDEQNVFENHALIVDDGKITDIIPQQDLNEDDFDSIEDFENSVITPGFINMGVQLQYNDILKYKKHTIKGFFITMKQFFQMLGAPINSYPMKLSFAEKKYICLKNKAKKQNFRNGVQKAIVMGNTCIVQISKNDRYLKKHFELLNKLPIKTFILVDLYANSKKMSKKVFFKLRKTMNSLKKNISDTTFLGIYSHSIMSVHQRLWKILGKYSRRNKMILMTELLESVEEKEFVDNGFSYLNYLNNFLGQRTIALPENYDTVQYLKGLGVLSDNTVIKNGNYLNSKELLTLSESGVKFVISPRENENIYKMSQSIESILRNFEGKFGFSSGCSPLYESDYNLLNEIISLKSVIHIEDLIKYITLYPARILGIDKTTGSLEFNKHADFNVFELGKKQKNFTDIRYNTIPKFVYIMGQKVAQNGEIFNK